MFDAETWISIHALREESDAFLVGLRATESIFQSTLSARRATKRDFWRRYNLYNFNPRSPWGERLLLFLQNRYALVISIHALREESDIILFLAAILQTQISIHALREESDTINGQQYSKKDISIHALREESDYEVIFVQLLQVLLISIHALREESDWTDRLFWF